jgi:hypothetical protein
MLTKLKAFSVEKSVLILETTVQENKAPFVGYTTWTWFKQYFISYDVVRKLQ